MIRRFARPINRSVQRPGVQKASMKRKAELDVWDRWDRARELLGDDEMLNAIPKMLGTWKTEELLGWIETDYDINDDEYEASKKKATRRTALRKVTPKQLKDMVKDGVAVDITYSPDALKIKKEKQLECIGTGHGIYGTNCAMYKGNDGKIYVITARCSNLDAVGCW